MGVIMVLGVIVLGLMTWLNKDKLFVKAPDNILGDDLATASEPIPAATDVPPVSILGDDLATAPLSEGVPGLSIASQYPEILTWYAVYGSRSLSPPDIEAAARLALEQSPSGYTGNILATPVLNPDSSQLYGAIQATLTVSRFIPFAIGYFVGSSENASFQLITPAAYGIELDQPYVNILGDDLATSPIVEATVSVLGDDLATSPVVETAVVSLAAPYTPSSEPATPESANLFSESALAASIAESGLGVPVVTLPALYQVGELVNAPLGTATVYQVYPYNWTWRYVVSYSGRLVEYVQVELSPFTGVIIPYVQEPIYYNGALVVVGAPLDPDYEAWVIGSLG